MSLVGTAKGKGIVAKVARPPVDLDLIFALIHHGCMSLPQELVDHVIGVLYDDLLSLKACSLTCKSMFASARRLIHRTLCLTLRNNMRILPQEEKKHPLAGYDGLCFISYVGEHGLLRYTRQVRIRDPYIFTPHTLLPHLAHFRSLNQVHTLAIDYFEAMAWARYHKTCFAHLYPTLTSLALRSPSGDYRFLFKFALQFPRLENLCLESLRNEEWGTVDQVIVESSPPLHGHLRLARSVGPSVGRWLTELTSALPNKIKFRSVELECFLGQHAQCIVNGCGETLENLILVSDKFGER